MSHAFQIERKVRPTTEMANWKGAEWMVMLFYMSPTIFSGLVEKGLMAPDVLAHWLQLCAGIAYLNTYVILHVVLGRWLTQTFFLVIV